MIGYSSVWNYHNTGSFSEIAKNKRSNLHNELKDLHKKGHEVVTIVTGAIGRSQHSETELAIFAGETDSGYTTLNLSEVFA